MRREGAPAFLVLSLAPSDQVRDDHHCTVNISRAKGPLRQRESFLFFFVGEGGGHGTL